MKRKTKAELFPNLVMSHTREDYIRFLCLEYIKEGDKQSPHGLLTELLVDWFLDHVPARKPSGREISEMVDYFATQIGHIGIGVKLVEYQLNKDTGVSYRGAGSFSEESIQKAHTRYGRRKKEINDIMEGRRARMK